MYSLDLIEGVREPFSRFPKRAIFQSDVCVCVCVCVRERERERECVCVCERERERESVCVWERERERERESEWVRERIYIYIYIERERERETASKSKTEISLGFRLGFIPAKQNGLTSLRTHWNDHMQSNFVYHLQNKYVICSFIFDVNFVYLKTFWTIIYNSTSSITCKKIKKMSIWNSNLVDQLREILKNQCPSIYNIGYHTEDIPDMHLLCETEYFWILPLRPLSREQELAFARTGACFQ